MNNKKINTLLALAIAASVITSANLNTTIASAATKDLSINTESSSTGYGIASFVYEQLLEKGWSETSNDTLTVNGNMFKFRNLNGVNGKDASVVIKCADEEYDHYILELLDLMVSKGSTLTSKELAFRIANGSGTIQDGSRLINIHYDGKVDYTITLTFYNYGYEPSYVLPSLDNCEMISTLESLINKNILSLTNIWGGTEKKPLEMEVNSSSTSDIDDLFNSLNSISDTVNSAKIIENSEYSILQINFNKENSLYNGTYFDYITVNLKMDNSNEYAIESANNLVNEFNKVSTDDDSQTEVGGDGFIEVPGIDLIAPPTNEDESQEDDFISDEQPVINEDTSNDSQNKDEITTDSSQNDDESTPEIDSVINTEVSEEILSLENATDDNTVNVNSTSVNTETNNSTEVKSLPKTGGVSSLPFLGMLSLSLGSILNRKKK